MWVAGFEGTVLGWGDTAESAADDAVDFCDGGSGVGLEVVPASTELQDRVSSSDRSMVVDYVVRDGAAHVR